MNQLIEFEGLTIRMVGTTERPEWIAADVCRILGIDESRNVLRNFKSSERGACIVYTPSRGQQEVLTVTEPGLYRLIFKSRKPEADRFRTFVTHDVLPSIRKHGCYPPPELAVSSQAIVSLDAERFENMLTTAIGNSIGRHMGPMQSDIAEVKHDVKELTHEFQRHCRRKAVTKETRNLHVQVVFRMFGGVCPCCSRTRIVNSHGQPLSCAEVDHWRLPSQNDKRWTWVVCAGCNSRLRDADFHDSHEAKFRAYQENLKHLENIIRPRLPGMEDVA